MTKPRKRKARKRDKIKRELVDRLTRELELTPPSTIRTAADMFKIIMLTVGQKDLPAK